jgi:hypothetical protein
LENKAFKKFRELIEKEEFFDAHEVLEEIWHPMRKSSHPDSDIIRGFINAAVSLELKKNTIFFLVEYKLLYTNILEHINFLPLYFDSFHSTHKPFYI